MADRQIVTLKELSEVLRVSPSTVSRWAARGVLPCIRGPRAVRFDLDEALAALKREEREAATR